MHTAHEVGQRRMMQMGTQHTAILPVSSTLGVGHTIPTPQTAAAADPVTFPFRAPPYPTMGYTFAPRPPRASLKRGRAAADIDGEHSHLQKKKRRLRLLLITSRLSPQFSHPATNIVDRGISRIAVWARQKPPGRNLLCKAAILNSIRRSARSAKEAQQGKGRVLVEQEREQEQLRLAKLEFKYGSVDTYTRPVIAQVLPIPPPSATRKGVHFITSPPRSSPPPPPQPNPSSPKYQSPNEAYLTSTPRAQAPQKDHHLPHGPSPLGLSNYDALDMEDDIIPDPYSHLDDDDDDDDEDNNEKNGYTAAFPHHDEYGDEDEDEDECPFSPTAITPSPLFNFSLAQNTPKDTRVDSFTRRDGVLEQEAFRCWNLEVMPFGG